MNYDEITQVLAFANAGPFLMAVGGIGDALLTVTQGLELPRPRILFWCGTGFADAGRMILAAFDVNSLVLDVSVTKDHEARFLFKSLYHHKNLLATPVAPLNLSYREWQQRPDAYFARFATSLPLKDRFGVIADLGLAVCILPKGSADHKMIHPFDFMALVEQFKSKGYRVFGVGPWDNAIAYGKDVCEWIGTDYLYAEQKKLPINTRIMFKVINSCSLVVSVDSWLKTYSCLAGITTQVIANKEGRQFFIERVCGDWIFLNTKYWKTMSLVSITDLLENQSLNTAGYDKEPVIVDAYPADGPVLSWQ